jgi:RNA polymerase sigma-70 factor, ECF subfamily
VNEAELEALYCALAPRLRRYLARLCRSDAVAEELVQEAFFRFLRTGFPGSDEEERTRYLFTIATNLARNRWSRHREHAPLESVTASACDPAEQLHLAVDLNTALDKLGPRERALVWLACAEGYDHQDIARILGVGRASVRVLLFRARRKLASLLETGS